MFCNLRTCFSFSDGDYSMSFDDSLTEEESFKQVLPSESHRKDARRRKSDNFQSSISKDEGVLSCCSFVFILLFHQELQMFSQLL